MIFDTLPDDILTGYEIYELVVFFQLSLLLPVMNNGRSCTLIFSPPLPFQLQVGFSERSQPCVMSFRFLYIPMHIKLFPLSNFLHCEPQHT